MTRSLVRPLTRSLTRSLVRGPSLDPEITTIAAMGDSLSSGINYSAENTVESGYLWPVFAQTDRRITPVVNSSGGNFNTGGFTAEQIRDTWLPEVITAAPSACVVLAGTNGLAAATSTHRPNLDAAAESVFVVIAEIATELKNAGITPIMATITPDNFPTDETFPPAFGSYHPDYRVVRKKINDLIRANAKSLGAVLCDWAGVISTDPTDDTALADARYLFDSVHFYASGNQQLGDFLRRVIDQKFRVTGPPFAIPAIDSAKWVTGNPYMLGNSSGKATGWDISTTDTTVTNSKTADGWQRIVCTDGPDPGVNANFRLIRSAQVTDTSFDGRTYQALIEFHPQSSDFELWHALVECACLNLDDGTKLRRGRSPQMVSSTQLAEIGAIWTHNDKFFLLTPPTPHLGGIDAQRRRIIVQAFFYGRGTVDVRVCGVIDVTPD